MPKLFNEVYEVTFSYTNESGFRVQSQKEMVLVTLRPGAKEKCNHHKAEKLIKEKYQGKRCEIVRVSYC